MKRYKDLELDEEEQALVDAFENGEMELKTPTKQELEEIRNAALNTLKNIGALPSGFKLKTD